jgi:hypothetical protein
MPKSNLLQAVRDILFRDWDPIGVNGNNRLQHEYDTYAPSICRLLAEGADESRLVRHLSGLLRGHSIDAGRNRQAAQCLLRLVGRA